ncbi:hypothetical protein ACHAWF_010940 [Thalassiosira exigua]
MHFPSPTAKGKLEILGDDEAPVPEQNAHADLPKINALSTAIRSNEEGRSSSSPRSSHSAPPRSRSMHGGEPAAGTIISPSSVRPLEATLVQSVEATLIPYSTVYEATLVPGNAAETESPEESSPWWKRHQRFIILKLITFIAVLLAILGGSLVSRRDHHPIKIPDEESRQDPVSDSPEQKWSYTTLSIQRPKQSTIPAQTIQYLAQELLPAKISFLTTAHLQLQSIAKQLSWGA